MSRAKHGTNRDGFGIQPENKASWSDVDVSHMNRALNLARQAQESAEVPVGAVLVSGGVIIGEGRNRPIAVSDPTAHAEMEALRQAAGARTNYRLADSTMYVTLEPCVMCSGALVLARIGRLVFAARDLRFGAVRSKFRLADSPLLNHRIAIEEGLFATEASELLTAFFASRR